MIKNLNRIANDTNKFLNSYIKRQSKTELIKSMKYGLLPGGKKIRSKILIDMGRIFNINYGQSMRHLILTLSLILTLVTEKITCLSKS